MCCKPQIMQPHVQILEACGSSSRQLDALLDAASLLESVQKGLADYLETKRLAFASFFFLSNDELLQILSQAKVATAVQPHLRKCFEAVERLQFGEDLEIGAMQSREGEVMPLAEPMFPEVRRQHRLCTYHIILHMQDDAVTARVVGLLCFVPLRGVLVCRPRSQCSPRCALFLLAVSCLRSVLGLPELVAWACAERCAVGCCGIGLHCTRGGHARFACECIPWH